ncbi:DUF1565 domain-containing protein [Tumidithrix elongata RA019]|uniref:DUF1565 domain-containing protein n=1 Tax=Tumidithrix elongata BACA0141 TaxID=2716417 RepID=A0AAW9PVS0_9CYAN|nr:DUF1565 domain-containing protein [Tumidithrix elongata RA019]
MSKLRNCTGALLLLALGAQQSILATDVLAANTTGMNPPVDRLRQQFQPPESTLQIAQANNAIYVSPNADSSGDGSQAAPFRTITAALNSSLQPGTVIQLASGTYSVASGEVFPLKIPTGVILRGDPSNKGAGIVIRGGGRFVSPTFASQNVAIAVGSNAQVEGITVSNSNPRGYGLWVESSKNVTIANNTFTSNTHDGVFLTGSANAAIANNLFTRNTGSGISAVGVSTGEITGNTFDNTGFGLSIGQRSQVVLIDNRIINNVDGIVISNDAQPTLRGNLIANNNRNGLVVLRGSNGQTGPDLGITSNPGKNVFRDNREKDINNASDIALIAAGNQINSSRVNGALNLYASTSPVILPERIVEPPRVPSVPPRTPIAPLVARSQDPVVIPTEPPQTTQSPIVPVEPSTTPPTGNPVRSTTVPPVATSTAPTTILIERDLPPVRSTTGSTNVYTPTPVAPRVAMDPRTGKPIQFRVVVPLTSPLLAERVRAIVPDAFLNPSRSQIQVGAYSDRKDADAQVQKLSQSGVKAIVEPFNR